MYLEYILCTGPYYIPPNQVTPFKDLGHIYYLQLEQFPRYITLSDVSCLHVLTVGSYIYIKYGNYSIITLIISVFPKFNAYLPNSEHM